MTEIMEWMREPDYAGTFNLAEALKWLDRRPTAELHRLIERVAVLEMVIYEELTPGECHDDPNAMIVEGIIATTNQARRHALSLPSHHHQSTHHQQEK